MASPDKLQRVIKQGSDADGADISAREDLRADRTIALNADEQIQTIQAQLDAMRDNYHTARIALSPDNANASFDKMTREDHQKVVELYEGLDGQLRYFLAKKNGMSNILHEHDIDEPTKH